MTWLDFAVFGAFSVSVLLGAWRGLVREVISVLGWVIAFLAANLLAGPLGEALPQSIPTPELRVLAAFLGMVALFAAILRRTGRVIAESRETEGYRRSVRDLATRVDISLGGVVERIDAVRRHHEPPTAIADNLANVNTIRPYDQPAFQARFVEAQELPSNAGDPVGVGGGVAVKTIQYGDAVGLQRYEPGNPLANADGYVRSPNIDLGQNMTDLILAQRAYQLNLAVVDRASESYRQAIQINGK